MLNHRQIYIAIHTLDIYGCIVDCVGGLLLQLVVLLAPLPDLLHVKFLGRSPDADLQVHVLAQLHGRELILMSPATLHHLQHLTARFIQNGRQGPEIGLILGYWTLGSTFA